MMRARSLLLTGFVLDVALPAQVSKTRSRSSCFATDQVAVRSLRGLATASLKTALNAARSILALLRSKGMSRIFVALSPIGGNPKRSAVALTRSGAKEAVAQPKPA